MSSHYNNTMNKVQLTLTEEESKLLESKASKLGYSLTRYLKFLISREAADVVEREEIEVIPHLSTQAKKRFEKALKDIKSGKNIYKPKNKKHFFELLES